VLLRCYPEKNTSLDTFEQEWTGIKSPYFGYRGFSGNKGSTAVVATGPYTSYPTNFSAAAVDWTLKQQCCFAVGVCVSANSDVIFSLTELRFRNNT
jgi:hypothetical protein